MRKLPEHLDSPIDVFMLRTVELTEGIFRYFNFTPNMLTFISSLDYIFSFIAWLYGYMFIFFILFWKAYYFDCCDGFYARKYNQVTVFGDYFDHVKDLMTMIPILGYICYNLFFLNLIYLLLFLAFTFMTLINVSATEKYLLIKNNSNSQTLSFLLFYNPGKSNKKIEEIEDTLYKTKIFGVGSTVALMSILLSVI